MSKINIGTIDKLQNFISGFVYASLRSKPLLVYTALRHLLKYLLRINLKPMELKLRLKGHLFYFKEFTGEIGMFNQIYVKKIYSSYRGFHNIGKKNGTILDVGANIGMFTIDSASANPDFSLYSFEPNPDVYCRLKENVALNKLKNVRCHNIGFSDETSTGYLDDSTSTVLGRISSETSRGSHKVMLGTLDNFISQHKIRDIDLIKIDVEGFEYHVIKGLKNSLARVGKIVMECDEALETDVIDYLKAYNFSCVHALPRYRILYFQNAEHST